MIARVGVLASAVVATMVLGAVSAGAQEYQVDLTQANRATFRSRAPIEDFEGVTDRVDGFVFLKGDGLVPAGNYAGSELYFEVELDGLDTGMRLRNRHMRRNYLETKKYPYAAYTAAIRLVQQAADGGFVVTASGTMAIHGVEREMDVECPIASVNRGYRVRCNFSLLLSNFNIKIPSLMFMKISDTIALELDFYVTRIEQDQ